MPQMKVVSALEGLRVRSSSVMVCVFCGLWIRVGVSMQYSELRI